MNRFDEYGSHVEADHLSLQTFHAFLKKFLHLKYEKQFFVTNNELTIEIEMVFYFENCSVDTVRKIVLVIEKNFWKFEAKGQEFTKSQEQFI